MVGVSRIVGNVRPFVKPFETAPRMVTGTLPHMRGVTRMLATVIAISACGTQTAPTPSSTVAPPTTPAPAITSTSTTTTTPLDTGPPQPACVRGEPEFSEDGLVATLGTGAGDAASIGNVRWEIHEGCERVVVDLLTADGAPAGTLGESSVGYRAESGVIRIDLPAVETGIADAKIEGGLAQRMFVVRTATGNLAVDIHLGSGVAALVRASEIREPARVVVDIAQRAGDDLQVIAPLVVDNLVLLTPAPGPARYPLNVSGYARTFEANVTARLVVDGSISAAESTTAADWLDAWGEFAVTFETGPPGDVTLLVGEVAAADGHLEGGAIRLHLP